MMRRMLVLLLGIVCTVLPLACVAVESAGGEEGEPIRPFKSPPACAWTGKELLLWDGESGYALDPEKNAWRTMARHPHARNGIVQPHLLNLGDGKVLAASWLTGRQGYLSFDMYEADLDRWRAIGQFDAQGAGARHENGESPWCMVIQSLARLEDASLVFVHDFGVSEVIGYRIDDDGQVTWISGENAPEAAFGDDVAVYAHDGKVLYWGYAHVAHNTWSVWDAATDTWQKPEEFDRAYSFGHCFTGDEVYIYGGAESSAFGWTKDDGWVYSFETGKWRELPKADGPGERRDFAMCWTGTQVLVWGGERRVTRKVRVNDQEIDWPFFILLNSGGAFDPKTERWTALPTEGAPSARFHCIGVWTGTEMIVWGGLVEGEGSHVWLYDGHAYDPEKRTWRELPSLVEYVKKLEAERRNWPHMNPTEPPTDERFAELSLEQLMPLALAEQGAGRFDAWLACAWYMWKTRDNPEARKALADAIVQKLGRVKSRHDYAYLARMLGPLGAHDHLVALLDDMGQHSLDCCYGPALVEALAECGSVADVPVLIATFEKETEACGGVVNKALEQVTGVMLPAKDDSSGTGAIEWYEWWEANKDKLLKDAS